MLTEASLTQVTFIRLLLVVDIPHMPLQVGRDREGSFTKLALVRLFARVGAQVSRQVGRSWKSFAAILAAVSLLVGFADSHNEEE